MLTGKISINKRALIISSIVGLLFGVLNCIGYAADKTGELMVGAPLWWLCMILITLIVTVLFYIFLIGTDKKCHKDDSSENSDTGCIADFVGAKVSLKQVVITAGIIFICWLPVFLAVYPGFFVYDATDEFVEVATRNFSTHHPLLHVLLLGGTVCAGNKVFGNYNAGIAIYTIFQMLTVSAVFGWITVTDCSVEQTQKSRRISYILHLVWYGLFPTVVMFALCSAKDTLFSAFMLIAVEMVYRLAVRIQSDSGMAEGKKTVMRELAVLLFALVLMMLMRHNGVYAVLVLGIVAGIFLLIVNKRKKAESLSGTTGSRTYIALAVLFVLVLGIYKLTDAGLVAVTHADTAENQEILTVPIQQIARCWGPYQSEMTKAEKDAVLTYIPESALARYTPNLSDPVKVDFCNKSYAEKKGGFIKVWLKLMRKHPLSYINAWVDTSYGFYYPWTVVNVYEGHTVYTFTYDESSYFGYETENPGERHSFIPVIERFYRWLSLDDDIQRIPVLHLFFSMGALFWVYAFAMGLFIYKKNYAAFTALSLPAGVWLTLLLGPTFLPRYTVFLWFILPVCIRIVIHTLSFDYKKRLV